MVAADGGLGQGHAGSRKQRRVAAPCSTNAPRAWWSLCILGVAHLCVGCFDAPPQYQVAERGIPVIDRFGVDPAPGSVQVETNPDATISFYVPFRAEDNGTDLQAIFWRDFNPLDPPTDLTTLIRIQDVPASGLPFSEQPAERAVSVDWSPRGLGGCHSVTMFLTYVDNVIFEDVPTIDEESLVAVETWWFRFEIPGAPDPDCPAVPVETSL